MEEDAHTITPHGDPRETVNWAVWRGYRAIVISDSLSGTGGLLLGRKNEPAILAVIGDVLVCRDGRISIE